MTIDKLCSRAADYLAYQWNLSNAIPTKKVQTALEAEGWTFKTAEGYPSTVIDNPTRFNGQGLQPIDAIAGEMAITIMCSGDPKIVDSYSADKKRLAAQTYGIT